MSRGFLKDGRFLTFVGAHNPFVAKLVEKAGFDGVYLSGAGLSNSMGVSDTGILGLNDFTYFGKRIVDAVSLPVLSDADTGFKDIEETIEAYIKAGISGCHLEDQVFPKRCGHLVGKEVVDKEQMIKKIQQAVSVRDHLNSNFVIIARTDARGAENIKKERQFSEAMERGRAYLKAGADVIFPESLVSIDELKLYRKEVEGALLANMTEFGKTPFITATEFKAMGYQMVIFPVSIFRYLAGCTKRALDQLKADGNQKGLVKDMMTRDEINKVLNYKP